MRNYKKPSAIIFDFDDTLVDAKPIIDKALSATFTKFNIDKNIIKTKNIDTNRSLRDYFYHIFADNIIEARDAYYNYYYKFSEELKVLDQSEDVLKLLHKNKVFTVVVSNKRGEKLRSEIKDNFLWQDYFSAVVGAGDVEEDKPSPMPAKFALQKSGLKDYSNVWFVGDSLVDLQTAKNLGCKAVLFGDSLLEQSHDMPVYFSISNHSEFLKLLQGIYV